MAREDHYEPLDDWLRRHKEISTSKLIYAERAGYPLPLWFRGRGDALVNTSRAYNWTEIVEIMDATEDRGAA